MNILLLLLSAIIIGATVDTFYPSRKHLNLTKVIAFSFLMALAGSCSMSIIIGEEIFNNIINSTTLMAGIATSLMATIGLKTVLEEFV